MFAQMPKLFIGKRVDSWWADEVAWNGERRAIDELGGGRLEIVLRRGPDAQEDPRQLIQPVWAVEAGT